MQFPKHNNTDDKIDCYISYNFGDISIYGTDTTAIVIGQMQRFYILKGNHFENLKNLTNFKDCIEYYLNNLNSIHKMSDKYDKTDAEKVINDYIDFKNQRSLK